MQLRRLVALFSLIFASLVACACDAGIEDIGLRDAGWKTYRNVEFGYEISYPAEWELTERPPEPGDVIETQWVRVAGVTERRDVPPSDESVLVAVNFQQGWCAGAGRIETRPIVVDSVQGIEQDCYRTELDCKPQPNCLSHPYGIARLFEGTNGRQNYLVLGDPTSDPLLVRRIIESFGFLDAGQRGGDGN